MKQRNKSTGLFVGIAVAVIFLSFGSPANAIDDGARAYWKARDGTHVVSTQYLFLDMVATDTQAFDPAHFIFPNSKAEANLFMASYAYHFTLLDRPSSIALNLLGGSADVDVDTNFAPSQFLPSGVVPGASFSQSATGFGDPTVQLDVNLFGTPPLFRSSFRGVFHREELPNHAKADSCQTLAPDQGAPFSLFQKATCLQ